MIGKEVRFEGRIGVIVAVSGKWIEIQLYGDINTVWATINDITFIDIHYAKSSNT